MVYYSTRTKEEILRDEGYIFDKNSIIELFIIDIVMLVNYINNKFF